jgi:hypothetical protein
MRAALSPYGVVICNTVWGIHQTVEATANFVGVKKNDKIAALRLARMEQLIERLFSGNGSAFARAAGKKPTQIQDMRSAKTQKPFGEKVARTIEASLRKNGYKVPVGYLVHADIDAGTEVRDMTASYAASALINERHYEPDELELLTKLLDLPLRVRTGLIEAISGAHEIAFPTPTEPTQKRKAPAPA